jgi:hypothetical protein
MQGTTRGQQASATSGAVGTDVGKKNTQFVNRHFFFLFFFRQFFGSPCTAG